MPDSTRCYGSGCNLRSKCRRHSPPQSYFAVVPKDTPDECIYFVERRGPGGRRVCETCNTEEGVHGGCDCGRLKPGITKPIIQTGGTYIGPEHQFKGRHANLVIYPYTDVVMAQFDTGKVWETHSRLNFPKEHWHLDEEVRWEDETANAAMERHATRTINEATR